MTTKGTGCLSCGQPVQHPEFTLLCDKCDADNLTYANEEQTMSNDPFDDPGWLAYAERVRKELAPMIEKTAIGVSIFNGTVDPKMAIETGYLILLDKPIIAVVTPGSKMPAKLALVADEIIELSMDDPSFQDRLKEAIDRVFAKRGQDDPDPKHSPIRKTGGPLA